MTTLYDPSMDPTKGIAAFLKRAAASLSTAETNDNLQDTRASRTTRRYSIKEACHFLSIKRSYFDGLLRCKHAPQGEMRGREKLFTADDIMRLRLINRKLRKNDKEKVETIFWRDKTDPIPTIVVGGQKGGSGKSLTSVNLAHFCQAFYGLRVGILDADPQATASLYFADDKIEIGSIETQTFTNFMGMQEPGEPILQHDPEMLDSFWKATSWPGMRLLPGGPTIQEGDINLFFLFKNPDPELPMFHELLKTALKRYNDAYQPKTEPEDIFNENDEIDEDRYQQALNEAFDIIIIDCAPALSLTMLNTISAGTSLIVPSSLKGFDINTMKSYTSSASDLIGFLDEEKSLDFEELPSFILPTIVSLQTMTDLSVLKSLMDHDPDIICPVFYARSEAVANAAEHFQSLYDYVPPKGKKKSTDRFLDNANAVGDAIISKCAPRLPPRGFANSFIEETYGGAIAPWTEEAK